MKMTYCIPHLPRVDTTVHSVVRYFRKGVEIIEDVSKAHITSCSELDTVSPPSIPPQFLGRRLLGILMGQIF